MITKETFNFLNNLSHNNERTYFNDNRESYLKSYENMIQFTDALLNKMNSHDYIETLSGKKSLYRIFKDVRFSKDKTPYNTYWSGNLKRATKHLRGGYYFHIEPRNSFVAGGFWGPNKEDMARIRLDIDLNYEQWDNLFNNETIVQTFGKLSGEQLNTSPRGFKIDHPGIKYLRFKQFLLIHTFKDEEVLNNQFVEHASEIFQKMRPFLDHMSEILTTDGNGISLIE